jgi:hypothetical protein
MMKKTLIFTTLLILFLSPDSIINGQDPQGIFLNDFKTKTAILPPYEFHLQNVRSINNPTAIVDIDYTDTIAKVSKYVYGTNANPYMSQIVTEAALMGHIKKLSPNIIRFPGGNLSSVFFWNSAKDQPPADAPAKLLDAAGTAYTAGYWYGKNTESWTLSVDNYYSLLSQSGSAGMITINYGYARYGTGPAPVLTAAHYAADWVRYDKGKTRFWEIGNESNGTWQAGYRIDKTLNQDNQPDTISGALYGEHFNIFVDSMKAAAQKIGKTIYIGAQVFPYDASTSWNPPDRTWNDEFFSKAGNKADFFIVHSYYTPYNENSSPAVILNSAQTETSNMIDYLKTYTVQNGHDMKPVALTEWNIFAVGSKQACSYINGMHAAIVLGELIKNQYGQAARWDLANGYSNGDDHGMFNNRDESVVPDWNPRPAFFYMYYFQKYFGNYMIKSTVSGDQNVLAYTSLFSSGEIGVVIINKGSNYASVRINIPNFGYGERYYMYNLSGGTDNGSFSQKVYVNDNGPSNQTGGPIDNLSSIKSWSRIITGPIVIASPAKTVQFILIDNGNKIIDAVEDVEEISPLVYPNPASDKISIVSPVPMQKVEFVSLQGNVIKTCFPTEAYELVNTDLSLTPGIYLVKVFNTRGFSVKKVVIINK